MFLSFFHLFFLWTQIVLPRLVLLARTGINRLRDLCLSFSCEEWHEISWLLRIFSLFSVFHCPNGCFHNGECVGAVCFCYQGWTGEDCSKFHCHDLHNCSGNGECMGPNVCKCYPGYLVRLLLFCIAVRRGNNAGNIYKFLCRFNKPMEITLSTNYSLMTFEIHVSTSDRENSNLSQWSINNRLSGQCIT